MVPVLLNKDILITLRTSCHKPENMQEQSKRLQQVNNVVLKSMTIIVVILSFRHFVQEPLGDVLDQRIPFWLGSVQYFYGNLPSNDPINRIAFSKTRKSRWRALDG